MFLFRNSVFLNRATMSVRRSQLEAQATMVVTRDRVKRRRDQGHHLEFRRIRAVHSRRSGSASTTSGTTTSGYLLKNIWTSGARGEAM